MDPLELSRRLGALLALLDAVLDTPGDDAVPPEPEDVV